MRPSRCEPLALLRELSYNSYKSEQCTLTTKKTSARGVQRRIIMCEAKRDTLTVKEMQEILKIGTNSAYNLIHSKAFPVIKIGQSYRIPKESFYAWMANPYAAKH